jgi:putative flippase GtrA
MVDPQIRRYLLAGGLAAGFNFMTRHVLGLFMSFEIAVLIAYVAAVFLGYALNRFYVFGPSGRSISDEFTRYLVATFASLAAIYIISVVLYRVLFPQIGFVWHADDVAHFLSLIVSAFLSYWLMRQLPFSAPQRSK